MLDETLYGGVELGGTKTLVAVGHRNGRIVERALLPTIDPQGVVNGIKQFFDRCGDSHGPVASVGVGAFGPIVLDPEQGNYGRLLDTNKPGWSQFGLAEALSTALNVPIRIITDVGAAGLGEARFGALSAVELGVYLTVGTGIGGAILCRGELLPAALHPEMGHLPIFRHERDDAPSTCLFHENCAEGLAAGPAIMARFGKPLSALNADVPEHGLIADYLGQLCASLVLALSPHRIVLGGGVASAPGLVRAAHSALLRHLGRYATDQMEKDGFLCPPALGQDAGVIGALSCAPALCGPS